MQCQWVCACVLNVQSACMAVVIVCQTMVVSHDDIRTSYNLWRIAGWAWGILHINGSILRLHFKVEFLLPRAYDCPLCVPTDVSEWRVPLCQVSCSCVSIEWLLACSFYKVKEYFHGSMQEHLYMYSVCWHSFGKDWSCIRTCACALMRRCRFAREREMYNTVCASL